MGRGARRLLRDSAVGGAPGDFMGGASGGGFSPKLVGKKQEQNESSGDGAPG